MSAQAELCSIIGSDLVQEAAAADAIDGVRPALVARPGTVEEVGQVLSLASRAGWRVAPRGAGTRLSLGNPPERLDLVLDLGRLDALLEHAAGDLVVSVEAGVRLETLQAELAGAGQMLALDPAGPGGTIGGIIATNAAGPRRFRYGTVRDLLIGVTIVLANGTTAKAGGKVVKNVAGYDLSKLMTGSLGTLGVIVRAVFRLHPRPGLRRLVEVELATSGDVQSVVQRLLASTLTPSAIQLSWLADGSPRVGVLFEGIEQSVTSQSAAAVALLDADAATSVVAGDAAAERWADLIPTAAPVPDGSVDIKVSCLPARQGETIAAIRTAANGHGGSWRLTGMLGNGILELRLVAPAPDDAVAIINELRSQVQPGSVVCLAAPLEVKRQIDVWGPMGDTMNLMRSVKHRFDPDHLLNPGRFVGGI